MCFISECHLKVTRSIEIDGEAITGVPFIGEHCDLNIRSKIAHLVRVEGRSFLMAADSNALEPRIYDHSRSAIGAVDVLFLGMECEGAPMSWTYGPLLATALPRKFDQARRSNGSNFERAVEIVNRLGPKQVYIYAMGQEPWMGMMMIMGYNEQAPQIVESNKLIQYCRERGIVAERPYCQKEFVL